MKIIFKRKNPMNKIALSILTILLASSLLLSACASSASAAASLPGTSWKLVSYSPAGSQVPSAAGVDTNLVFGTDGQVSGNLGCNGFSGSYEVKGGNIVFGLLASTLMACPDPQMTQEGTAFQVLAGTVRFEITGTSLTIYDASGAMSLTLLQVGTK
jgi:heat shock protein HslJ